MTRMDTKNKRRKYGAASWWSSQIHTSHAASSFILVLSQPFVMSSVCSTIVCACSAFTTRLAARQRSTERPAPLLPELLLHLWWRSHSVILTLASTHCTASDEDIVTPPPASGEDVVAPPPPVDIVATFGINTEQVHTIGKQTNQDYSQRQDQNSNQDKIQKANIRLCVLCIDCMCSNTLD